jgi:hypothetical protein
VQQVTQENGALSASGIGDAGYSFGIGQWYNPKIPARRVMELHPERASLDWQVTELARSSCSLYKDYPGDIRRAIVHHNCPQCAIHNAKPKNCGGVDSYRKIGKRWSCYFDDEVDGNGEWNETNSRGRIAPSSRP